MIPIVLYNATRKWNAPRYFKDIVNKSEFFGDNIVNFKYQLFDVNHQYTTEELSKNNLIPNLSSELCYALFLEVYISIRSKSRAIRIFE